MRAIACIMFPSSHAAVGAYPRLDAVSSIIASSHSLILLLLFDSVPHTTAVPLGIAQCVDPAALDHAGIPGLELLTNKHSLAHVSRLLGWERRFVPETAMDKSVGRDMPLEWLAKRGTHRGVYPLGAASRFLHTYISPSTQGSGGVQEETGV